MAKKASAVNKAATNITTDANLTPATKRMRLTQISNPSLSTRMGRIYEEARKELRFPESNKLYKQMLLDPNIATATGLIEMLLTKVDWKITVPDSAPQQELEIKKKLNWNILSMERPWEEYIGEIISYICYGFCPLEKIYSKYNGTPYGDFIGISDMVSISQDTVSKWIFNKGDGKLVGLRQDTKLIESDLNPPLSSKEIDIPRKKFILFRHSVKRNNPEGTSPLRSCYVPWKMRNLVEEYETIGVSKDLGGTPVIGIDVAYLAKAEEDPTSDEARVVAEYRRQAASLHAGQQTYVIVPLAYDEKGKELFSFSLEGVNGGGKQYETDTIVKRHDSKILMSFFADILKLGTDSHGSFALADSKSNILSMAIESHLKNIQKELNHDLMKQIYELNNWEYNPETSCKFSYGDIEKQSLEEVGKFLQRVISVGALRPTEKLETEIRELLFDLGSMSEDEDKEITSTVLTSKASSGMDKPGNGTSNSPSSRDNSSANVENA